ncbi:probable inositol transporter 2 [Solanum tuberosum]|uniref:probable inositol transporter 2 n=1 Tax=Solanum tuberosum TaxID=4113 RepID=UPI000739FE9C|nr:PREDICTED: probable inositol transporter 2 [Solanum tuberosum]
MTLPKHHQDEFGEPKLQDIRHQLDTFIIHMRCGDPIFSDLKQISDLAEALVNANLIAGYYTWFIGGFSSIASLLSRLTQKKSASQEQWFLDSGASDHISGNKNTFYILTFPSTLSTITLANGLKKIVKAIVFLLLVLLNETPQFLIKQGRVEEAKVVLKRIQKFGAEEELQQLAYLIENEDREPWQKLLHSPVLVINVATQIFQRLLALYSNMFLGPLFLHFIAFKYHTSFLASFLGGAIRVGVPGLAVFSYRFFGRRRTLLLACA